MSKSISKFFSLGVILTILFSLLSPFFTNQVSAETHGYPTEEIVMQPEGYLEELKAEDTYASQQIDMAENSGYSIDPTVYTVDDHDVIVYTSDDETVFGMIQFSDEVNSKLEIVMDSEEQVNYAKFTAEGESEILFEVNEDGSVDVIENGITTYALTNTQEDLVCNILISLSGHGIGAIYGAIARAVGGPWAAAVVGLINTIGWAAVTALAC